MICQRTAYLYTASVLHIEGVKTKCQLIITAESSFGHRGNGVYVVITGVCGGCWQNDQLEQRRIMRLAVPPYL